MTLQKTEQKRLVHNVEMKEVDRTFLTDRVEGIVGKIPELDARIDEVAQGWKTSRMGKVELTILRQAVYEMQYDSEVPSKVAINEAVNLANEIWRKGFTGIYQRCSGEVSDRGIIWQVCILFPR